LLKMANSNLGYCRLTLTFLQADKVLIFFSYFFK
jgi:hypothetical protein